MVFENKNDKQKNKDEHVENSYNSSSLDNIDLNVMENMDLNSFKNEMDSIKDAINNDSLDLSEDDKIKLQNELNLIYAHLNEKSKLEKNESEIVNSQNTETSSEDKIHNLPDEIIHDSNSSNENSIPTTETMEEFSVNDLFLSENTPNNTENNLNEINFSDFTDLNSDNTYGNENANTIEDTDLNSDNTYGNENANTIEDTDLNSDNTYGNENANTIEDTDPNISVDDALSSIITDYSDEVAIKVENVSMDFKVSKDKIDTFKEYFIRTVKRNKNPTKTIHALKNISFEITKGDRVGIIGFNGAGKSTLLKLLACVYYPTEGSITTKGKIAPLLELGAGFDMNYTGKDNIFLNGAFLGYPEEFLKEKYDEILEFSELGDAINYHVKTYSSGMRAKLGFSIATIVEPDILIIDEILSVGDIKFRRKSADKIKSLINSGITVLLVSHSVSQIRDLCNKAIWIDDGELKMMGNVNEVCDEYIKASTRATSEQLENLDLN